MKYPQSVPMPRDVENWLGGELEARGIDAVFYTRYILALMQQDPIHFEPCDSSTKAIWSGTIGDERTHWQSWDSSALKRLAAIRCLMSASSQKCEVESLVDELCIKLREIDSSGVEDRSAFAFQPQVSPYVDFDKSFAPLPGSCGHRDAEEDNADSAWTRGILRASLDKPDTAPSHEKYTSPLDCLSLNYGNLKMFGNVINYGEEGAEPSKEEVKRLYERSTENRNLDKVIAKLDSAIPQIWNPDIAVLSDPKTPLYAQNQAYFYNNRKLFSPTLFNYRHTENSFVPTAAPWSLGGAQPPQPSATQMTSAINDSKTKQENDPNQISKKMIEQDLPISARTHFRPIRPHGAQHKIYADGTSFAVTADMKDLQFQRSESGTLFLETGKYMEYKKNINCSGKEEFIPKFRVRQSNEKTCQTEDIGIIMVEDYESGEISESDEDEFYFPGDDELALNYEIEKNLPREKKVAKVVSAKLDDRWENPDKFSGETSEIWVQWGAKNEALVDDLIGDDNDDDDAYMVDDSESVSSVQWPQVKPSIWNSNTSLSSCGTCKRDVGADEDCTQNQVMPKREWQEIWGQPQCKDCKEEENASKSQQRENILLSERKECKSPIFRSAAFVAVKNGNMRTPNDTEPNKSQWISTELSTDWQWPKLGAALSAYLEESRMRAVELLSVWSPNGEVKEGAVKKANALRDLWSPHSAEEEFVVGREVWSPMLDQAVYVTGSNNNKRPVTYGLLREELSEDGEELLSDLSYLHLQQLGSLNINDSSDLLDDGTLSTNAPSPVWEEGHRFVSLWATWNLIEVIGQGKEPVHANETAQKERKRRHSSSQRMCELYMEGECRRPHCRFVHGDDQLPSDMTPTPPSLHFTHNGQRAFTL